MFRLKEKEGVEVRESVRREVERKVNDGRVLVNRIERLSQAFMFDMQPEGDTYWYMADGLFDVAPEEPEVIYHYVQRERQGDNHIIHLQVDEKTLGVVVDILGRMTGERLEDLGLTPSEITRQFEFYRKASKNNWYIEGLGRD